jgi:hypothetical protein
MSLRQVRVPREDGAVLSLPPLAEAGRLLAANRQILASHGPDLLGRPWADLRARARHAVLTAAGDYLRLSGEPLPSFAGTALVMAGHQPELFHPGVWVKHFALSGLARRHGVVPVNLVVDNDTVKSTSLYVPVLTHAAQAVEAHRATVPFDRWATEEPYEERTVHDEELFATFAQRAVAGWDFEPLLPQLWVEVLRQARRTPLLGERLAAARRVLERHWGCHNLEVPVSGVCRTEPFAWFTVHLVSDLPRLHAAYNASVHEYRKRYGLRSTSHPVPDLVTEGDWHEVPLWAWRTQPARRGRLMARRTAEAIELRVGDERWPALPRPEGSGAARTVAAWQDLERQGLKVRSRALTNTLYARLLLCELFVHGIGGGKYDEVTDAIIRRFYGIEPPGYLVLSATRLLPLPAYPVRAADARRLRLQGRDLFYNPQRHLDPAALADPHIADLVNRKKGLIRHEPPDGRGRRERFRQLHDVTEALRAKAAARLAAARHDLEECERQLRVNEVLLRRDYAFCLYPEAVLRPFCTQFL